MVVKSEGGPQFDPKKLSGRPSRQKRSSSANRRKSTSVVKASGSTSDATVYRVLIHLAFAVFNFRHTYAQEAIDYLFSLTSSNKKNISESEMTNLEASFNVVHHPLDHLFLPWITRPNLKGKSSNYLDTQFLADTVLSLERSALAVAGLSKQERTQLQEPVSTFLSLLGVTRRTTL